MEALLAALGSAAPSPGLTLGHGPAAPPATAKPPPSPLEAAAIDASAAAPPSTRRVTFADTPVTGDAY